MAESVRSSKCAIVEQPADALVAPTAGTDYVALQSGFSLTPAAETLENEELRGGIAAAKPVLGLESSTFSMSHYLKGSGTVAAAPEEDLMIKSVLGSAKIGAAEKDTVSSSTVSVINVDSGEGATYDVGEALMVKKADGWKVRNIYSISTDALTLAQNLDTAPGTGVLLGRSVLYKGADSAHPKLSVWTYLGAGAAVLAASKVQMNSMTINVEAGQPINADYEGEGLEAYYNPIIITSATRFIDFQTASGVEACQLAVQAYRDPIALAEEIQTKMNAELSGGESVTCVYNSTGANAGKFTITAAGTASFALLWNTGANTANSAATKLGFTTAANSTGGLSYNSVNVLSWDAPQTPSYDTNDFLVAKDGELLFGNADDLDCADLQSVTVNVGNTVEPVDAICAVSGRKDNVVVGREVTIDLVAYLKKHDVRAWSKYKKGEQARFTVNVGKKTGANWTPGSVLNLHSPSAVIQSLEIDTTGEFAIVNMSLLCYTLNNNPEFFINII